MLNLRIKFQESGGIEDIDKSFNVYAGSRQNILFTVAIPKTLLDARVEREGTQMMNVVTFNGTGIDNTGKQVATPWFSLSRKFHYVKDIEVEGVEYSLFSRRLPSVFTTFDGTYTIVVKIRNIISDETSDRVDRITTSQRYRYDVLPGLPSDIDEDPSSDPSEMEWLAGRQQTLEDKVDELQGLLDHGQKLMSIRIDIFDGGQYWWDANNNITIPQSAHNLNYADPMYIFIRKEDGTGVIPRYDGWRLNNDSSITLYTRVAWTGYVLVSGSAVGSAMEQNAVLWDRPQNLSPSEKEQALANIGQDLVNENLSTRVTLLEENGGGDGGIGGAGQSIQLNLTNPSTETWLGILPNQSSANVAFKSNIDGLSNRVKGLENLGSFAGAFDTFALVPTNASAFPMGLDINDFINVRVDETRGGAVTQYVLVNIDSNGDLMWEFNIELSTDITGLEKRVDDIDEFLHGDNTPVPNPPFKGYVIGRAVAPTTTPEMLDPTIVPQINDVYFSVYPASNVPPEVPFDNSNGSTCLAYVFTSSGWVQIPAGGITLNPIFGDTILCFNIAQQKFLTNWFNGSQWIQGDPVTSSGWVKKIETALTVSVVRIASLDTTRPTIFILLDVRDLLSGDISRIELDTEIPSDTADIVDKLTQIVETNASIAENTRNFLFGDPSPPSVLGDFVGYISDDDPVPDAPNGNDVIDMLNIGEYWIELMSPSSDPNQLVNNVFLKTGDNGEYDTVDLSPIPYDNGYQMSDVIALLGWPDNTRMSWAVNNAINWQPVYISSEAWVLGVPMTDYGTAGWIGDTDNKIAGLAPQLFSGAFLTRIIGGTTSVPKSLFETNAVFVANKTLLIDTSGTLGVYQSDSDSSTAVIITKTISPIGAGGRMLGDVATFAQLPTTVSGAVSIFGRTPNIDDWALVLADESQGGGTWEYYIISLSSDPDPFITWGNEREINTGDYQIQSSASDSGMILTGGAQDGTWGTSLNPATFVRNNAPQTLFNLFNFYGQTYFSQQIQSKGMDCDGERIEDVGAPNLASDAANKAYVDNGDLINRPDLWTANTVMNFGNNLYGYRATGSVTIAGNTTFTSTPVVSGVTKIISSGGMVEGILNTTRYSYPLGCIIHGGADPIVGALILNSFIQLSIPGGAISFYNRSGAARTSAPFDIWVLYNR